MRKGLLKCLLIVLFEMLFIFSTLQASTGFEKEIDTISKTMADKIAAAGKKKVAVVDFTDLQGSVTELGRFIAEEFSVSLAGAGKGFIVVDRTHLKTILKEHKLSTTGLIDPETAKKLGKIAGVEALVTGTLTPLGESVRITVKILDTETAAIIDANRGNIAMTNAIRELMGTEVTSSAGQKTFRQKKFPPGKSQQTREAKDFVFELLGCKLSDRTVTCTLLTTNKIDDREIQINQRSVMYDDFGNEYRIQTGQIANSKRNFPSYWDVRKVLISGVPTKTILTFQKVTPDASIITSLTIMCNSDGEFNVNFRNIPLIKK